MTLQADTCPSSRRLIFFLVVVLVGVTARMLIAPYGATYGDEIQYEKIAYALLAGKNIYSGIAAYNYAPAWACALAGMAALHNLTGVPLYLIERGFLTLADVLNALLIALIAGRVRPGSERTAFVAYLLCPLSIYVTGYEGQFDILAMLPLLIAVYVFLQHGQSHAIWLLVTLAIIIKHIVAFLAWYVLVYVFGWRRAVLLMLGSAALFAATFIPFLPGGATGIYNMVLRYGGVGGRVIGLGILLSPSMTLPIFVGTMLVMPLLAQRLKLEFVPGLVFAAAGMFIFLPAASENYWMILIAVGSLLPTAIYWLYAGETSFLVWFPWFWFFPSMGAWWPFAVLGYNLQLIIALLWWTGHFMRRSSPTYSIPNPAEASQS